MHGTSGLVAMTSASHAEGRQFDPGQVYSWSESTDRNSAYRTCGLVAMTSASHAEGCQFDPGLVYIFDPRADSASGELLCQSSVERRNCKLAPNRLQILAKRK